MIDKLKEKVAALLADKNRSVKFAQRFIIGALIISITGAFLYLNNSSKVERARLVSDVSITTIDGVEAEDRWLETAAGRVTKLEENIEDLSIAVNRSLEESEALQRQGIDLQRSWVEGITRYENLFNEVQRDLTKILEESARNPAPTITTGDGNPPPIQPFAPIGITPQNQIQDESQVIPQGQTPGTTVGPVSYLTKFELSPRNINSPYDNVAFTDFEVTDQDPDVYLPAGSHAPAIVVTGADAPTSALAQGDPRPVTLRITGPAVSAANGAGSTLKTELVGCTVTGEARGDLSSERVYVRVNIMTCRHDDRIIETNVRGFVAGLGQAGVRGRVIHRSGDLVNYAFAGAFVEGFGGAVSSGFQAPTVVSGEGAAAANLLTDQEIISRAGKSGFGAGIAGAGATLSEYYIERAEQYQPVVSLKGGTEVEIVFLSGTYVDGRPQNRNNNNQEENRTGGNALAERTAREAITQ